MLQIVSGKMNETARLHCQGSALGPKVEMWIFASGQMVQVCGKESPREWEPQINGECACNSQS